VKVDGTEAAEQAVQKLETAEVLKDRLPGVYGFVANMFDVKARAEKEDSEQAETYFGKALEYYQKMLKAQPEQNFGMLYYILLLMDSHGANVALNTKLELAARILEESGENPDHADKIDRVKLVYADLLFEHGDVPEAEKLYDTLNTKFEKELEQRKEENPQAGRTAQHWAAKLGLARAKKALEKYKEAAADFSSIRQNVPAGGDTWWDGSYNLADCLIEMEQEESALRMIKTIQMLRPEMGGDETRGKFLVLLAKLVSSDDEKIRTEAQQLIQTTEANSEERQ
jgi:tetratricopeptide (TPR) repeat protein